MVGVIKIDDDFATLTLDQQLSGRPPPVRDNSATYGVDPSSGAITGGGSSTIKFNAQGACFKVAVSSENYGVEFTFNDNGGNENVSIFLRDGQSTPAQRWGYLVRVATHGSPAPFFRVGVVDGYSSTALFPDFPWTFAPSGINKIGFEAITTNFRVLVNDVVATTFTNTQFQPNGFATRVGVTFNSAVTGTSVMRGTRFTIYDSIVAAPAAVEYPIVRFG